MTKPYQTILRQGGWRRYTFFCIFAFGLRAEALRAFVRAKPGT